MTRRGHPRMRSTPSRRGSRKPSPRPGREDARTSRVARSSASSPACRCIDAQRGAVLEEQNRATEGQCESWQRSPVAHGCSFRVARAPANRLVLAEAAKQEADQGRPGTRHLPLACT